MTLTAAVVGTSFGLRVHVPALRAAGFEVVALVGTDPERTQRRAARIGVAHAAVSLADALRAASPDVVTIATPPHTHRDLALEAIRAGRHVICEKPMAPDAPAAVEMRDAARDAGVIALVGHEFRWDPAFATAADAIARGAIGRPHTALFTRAYSIFADPHSGAPDWWFDVARGGGWLGANGSHVVDQARVLLGDITEVSAHLAHATPRAAAGAEDGYALLFRTASGASGVMHETSAAWGDQVEVTRVAGDRGTVWLEGGRCMLATGAGTHELAPVVHAPATAALDERDPRAWTQREVAAYTPFVECFHALINGQQPAGPVPATFADGVAIARVLDAARRSGRAKCWIDVGEG